MIKKKVESKKITVNKVTWIANDGKEFNTKKDAEYHETSIELERTYNRILETETIPFSKEPVDKSDYTDERDSSSWNMMDRMGNYYRIENIDDLQKFGQYIKSKLMYFTIPRIITEEVQHRLPNLVRWEFIANGTFDDELVFHTIQQDLTENNINIQYTQALIEQLKTTQKLLSEFYELQRKKSR